MSFMVPIVADAAFSSALAGGVSFGAADALAGLATLAPSFSTIASVGSGLVSAFGSMQQGKAAAQSASYNAEIAANNQKLAQDNATAVQREGEINAAAASQKSRAELGGILANQGASGVDINSGSSIDTRSSAVQNGELSAINIRADAARKAYGYQVEGTNAGIQREIDVSEGKNSMTSGEFKAGSTVLGALTNPSNNWSDYQASQSM